MYPHKIKWRIASKVREELQVVVSVMVGGLRSPSDIPADRSNVVHKCSVKTTKNKKCLLYLDTYC